MRRIEIAQAAETRHFRASLPAKPQQNVHIMATFLQDHGAGLFTTAPVAPHEAMGMMPIPHVFNLRQRDYLPDLSCVDEVFDGHIKRRVT